MLFYSCSSRLKITLSPIRSIMSRLCTLCTSTHGGSVPNLHKSTSSYFNNENIRKIYSTNIALFLYACTFRHVRLTGKRLNTSSNV